MWCVMAVAALALMFAGGAQAALTADAAHRSGDSIDIAGSRIDVDFVGDFDLPIDVRMASIRTDARAVSKCYGLFPVPRLQLTIVSDAGSGIGSGTTYPDASIRVRLGRSTPAQALGDDWVLNHEMVCLALPSLAERHSWLSEGIVNCVEPVARVQIGMLPAMSVCSQLVRGQRKGLPQVGERDLDGTPTWSCRCWGGALFCTLADVEIRCCADDRRGLHDALRGIQFAGGDIRHA